MLWKTQKNLYFLVLAFLELILVGNVSEIGGPHQRSTTAEIAASA